MYKCFGGSTVEFFWLHQTILPPTPILLHRPLKKPSHPLLFYLSNCYWQKTSTFARVFFSMISCEKTKKTLQRARNNALLLLFLHHPKTSFFLSYYSRIYRPKSGRRIIGGRGESFLNSKSPSKLVFIRIRSAMNKEMFIYIYIPRFSPVFRSYYYSSYS